MTTIPFKLSKLAAGIGSVLWWMAYAPQLQAQPLQITVPIPLATTRPACGRIAARDFSALEARVLAAQDANPSAFVRAWRDAASAPGAIVVHDEVVLPRNMPAATGCPLTDAEVDAMVGAVEPDRFCVTEANGDCVSDDPRCMHNRELPAGFAYADGKVVDLRAKPKRVRVRAKPKRVRVRAKPLTVADIVVGGEYVPKRGNDKTPNFRVVERDDPKYPEDEGVLLAVERKGEIRHMSAVDFLALVARRVNA